MEKLLYSDRVTELGRIFLAKRQKAICRLDIEVDERDFADELSKVYEGIAIKSREKLREEFRQVEEYLTGRRTRFSVPLDLGGTEFQLKVWSALRRIPYGETVVLSGFKPRLVHQVKSHKFPTRTPCSIFRYP